MPKDCAFRDGDGIGPEVDYVKYADRDLGYVRLAFYHGLAKGEMIQARRYFYFDRPVTLKETAVYMMRCLKGFDIGDLEDNFKMAKESELIKPNDTVFNDGDSLITPNYFCVMLQRFLNQKRYFYFDEEFWSDIQKDEEGSMTYLEYLQSTKQENKFI